MLYIEHFVHGENKMNLDDDLRKLGIPPDLEAPEITDLLISNFLRDTPELYSLSQERKDELEKILHEILDAMWAVGFREK